MRGGAAALHPRTTLFPTPTPPPTPDRDPSTITLRGTGATGVHSSVFFQGVSFEKGFSGDGEGGHVASAGGGSAGHRNNYYGGEEE